MQHVGTRQDGAFLGRGGGLLLLALGLASVSLLFHATEGHRARLIAEALGVLFGGILTVGVVGVQRPTTRVVTRAFAYLGTYARVLFIVGLGLLFGFGLLTAGIAEVSPTLRQVPGFGGLVTLDWVVSLTFLGTASAMLLFLGILAIRARGASEPPPRAAALDDAILERLWLASNEGSAGALRRCFGPRQESERLLDAWCSALGAPGTSQVLLISSSVVWDKVVSEWHIRTVGGSGAASVKRIVLLAHVDSGTISSGDLFQVIPTAAKLWHQEVGN